MTEHARAAERQLHDLAEPADFLVQSADVAMRRPRVCPCGACPSNTTCVEPLTTTASGGSVSTTSKSRMRDPNGATRTRSPTTTGSASSRRTSARPSARFAHAPPLTGRNPTRRAGDDGTRAIWTRSFRPTFALARVISSICTRPSPRCSMRAGIARATVRRLPAIASTSPTSAPSCARSFGSSRAIPGPA
jgi:hypothetical protein